MAPLQVSEYKLWQTERSCMCCQEMGVREATVKLFCPQTKPGDPKFRKIIARSPIDCMCRPCSGITTFSHFFCNIAYRVGIYSSKYTTRVLAHSQFSEII